MLSSQGWYPNLKINNGYKEQYAERIIKEEILTNNSKKMFEKKKIIFCLQNKYIDHFRFIGHSKENIIETIKKLFFCQLNLNEKNEKNEQFEDEILIVLSFLDSQCDHWTVSILWYDVDNLLIFRDKEVKDMITIYPLGLNLKYLSF